MTRMSVAVLAAAMAGSAAHAQPHELVREYPPGVESVFYHRNRTEAVVTAGEQRHRIVSVETLLRRDLVLTHGPEDAEAGVAVFTRGTQQLVEREDNGQDLLEGVPEEQLKRPLMPALMLQRRDPRGRPDDPPTELAKPEAALEALHVYLGVLPEDPVKPGDTWKRSHDLGVALLTIRTTFVETQEVEKIPCAVLESEAELEFRGEKPVPLSIEKASLRSIEAIDGSGLRQANLETVVVEKREQFTQRVTRSMEIKRVETNRLADEALQKAREEFSTVVRVWELARETKLEEALQVLADLLRDRPESRWKPGLQALYSSLNQQRLATQPVTPMELRRMLKELRRRHDVAGAGGNARQIAAIREHVGRIVQNNFETLLEEASDPDPIVRDLAAFGLAFSERPPASKRLLELADDPSGRVRGTALVSLALRGKQIEPNLLAERLADDDDRVRGAAAMLASNTLADEPETAQVILPLLLENLSNESRWTRRNAILAVARLAPKGSKEAAKALVETYQEEKTEPLKALCLKALSIVTGVEAGTVEPYEEWLKQPAKPAG